MSEIQTAQELDGRGLQEVRIITDAMREHQSQVQDLGKRRKQLILRLRKQRITYREIAEAMGVSEQLIYKIIRNDIDREPQYDEAGNLIRRRGRPAKPAL
jgi:DNA invertase Pin-like site-specific DNA recombinase